MQGIGFFYAGHRLPWNRSWGVPLNAKTWWASHTTKARPSEQTWQRPRAFWGKDFHSFHLWKVVCALIALSSTYYHMCFTTGRHLAFQFSNRKVCRCVSNEHIQSRTKFVPSIWRTIATWPNRQSRVTTSRWHMNCILFLIQFCCWVLVIYRRALL